MRAWAMGRSGGRAHQAEGKASADTPRQECAWHVQGMARQAVWLEQIEQKAIAGFKNPSVCWLRVG